MDVSTGYPFYKSPVQKGLNNSIDAILADVSTKDVVRDEVKQIRIDSRNKKILFTVTFIVSLIIAALISCALGPIGIMVGAVILIAGFTAMPIAMHHFFKRENRHRDMLILNNLAARLDNDTHIRASVGTDKSQYCAIEMAKQTSFRPVGGKEDAEVNDYQPISARLQNRSYQLNDPNSSRFKILGQIQMIRAKITK